MSTTAPAAGTTRRSSPVTPRLLLEAGIVTVLFLLYNGGRLVVRDSEALAIEHAGLVRRLQSVLPLPSEAWIQGVAAQVPYLFEIANRYYAWLHFPVIIAFLVWGFWRRPRAEYVWARNLLVVTTFLALAIHLVFPLAPPRMFPEWGFVDTMTRLGPSPYDGASAAVANQFAAMPSLHIGWALLVAVVLARTAPRPLAWLAVVHAAVTVVVVVITANHWWLDGLVVAAVLGIALRLVPGPGPGPQERGTP